MPEAERAEMSEAELASRLYQSVADDERLRGDLTDAACAPLLRWCAEAATTLASSGEDFEELSAALRWAMRTLVAAVESGDHAHLAGIDSRVVSRESRSRAARALIAAPSAPESRAQALAGALR